MKKRCINFLTVSMGNLLEHYDKALFAFLAPYLAPLIYQKTDLITALIATYIIIPIGFLAKPLGSLIFGRMGDCKGRKSVLVITLFGMSITSLLTACIPILAEKTWVTFTLFSLSCFFQNFFSSGETVGGSLLLLESFSKKYRGVINGCYECSTLLGIFLASLFVNFLSIRSLIETHWRCLYLIGSLVGLLSLATRLFVQETPFSLLKKPPFSFSFFWKQGSVLLTIILTAAFSYTNYYMLTSFVNGFLPVITLLTKQQALQGTTYLLVLDGIILLIAGALTLRFSKTSLLIFFATIGMLLPIPLYLLLPKASIGLVLLIRACFLIIGVGFSVALVPFYQELIEREKRFSIIALGTAIGSQLGATASPLGFYLYKVTGSATAPSLYLTASGALAFWRLYCVKKNSRKKRDLS